MKGRDTKKAEKREGEDKEERKRSRGGRSRGRSGEKRLTDRFIHLFTPQIATVATVEPFSAAFPCTLAGRWIRSGAPET